MRSLLAGMSPLTGVPLAMFGALGALSATAAVARDAPRGALEVDDVCEPGADDEACALSALQTRSGRGGSVPPVTEHMKEARGAWTYDLQTYYDQWDVPEKLRRPEALGKVMEHMKNTEQSCENWNGYFWPRLSFFGKEFKKRERLAGDSEAEWAKLRAWTDKATFLACVPPFDPRHGTPWAKHVSAWMQKVYNSSSMDMPRLDTPFFMLRSTQMFAVKECHLWVKSLICELPYFVEKVQGETRWDEGSFCWDKVKHPGYGFTVSGFNVQFDLPPRPASVPDDMFTHSEYLQCQDHELDESYYKAICPFAGHYPDGQLGITWGEGPPEEVRPAMLECQAKLGAPFRIDETSLVWAWDPDVDLMMRPPWAAAAHEMPFVRDLVRGSLR